MNLIPIILFPIAYVTIGVIVAKVIDGDMDHTKDDWLPIFILFWPVILATLLVVGLLWLPCKLGLCIKEKIDKWF